MILHIKKILKKYLTVLFTFRRAKLIWQKPKQANVLIFDRGFDTDVLFEYIDKSKSEVLCVRGEEINIPILLLSTLNIGSYIDTYIKHVKPNFIVTFTDNSKLFYKLKSKHPNIIFIFFQNGLRTKLGDIFEALEKTDDDYEVDYMFTFNDAVGSEYRKYIKGESISIGSARNNLFSCENVQNKKKDILYISAFKPYSNNEEEHWVMVEGKSIKWRAIFSAERLVLQNLSRYCSINKIKLTILGRTSGIESCEYKFYKSIIQECNWNFIPNTGKSSSYDLMNQAEYIVGVDSTLLYEAFGRGKRVAFFTCRGETIGANTSQFGWPMKLKNKGLFWSNYINKNEFDRVMDYIINIHPDEWKKIHLHYGLNVMNYDPGNKKLISLFKKIKLPINKKYV
jgi:surface carbohydrate biosynthesis protein